MNKLRHIRLPGLIASSGLLALLAATPVLGADLGGNCCADLEERVAELEATSARKGNRKVSLTVSGHVNEAVMFWDDGSETNAYVVTNNASRTRFRFVGDAKINADWSAGYLLELGVRYAGSQSRTQFTNGAGGDANQIDIRHSAWWIENKQLGRVWVGETSSATDGITEINLSQVLIGGQDQFFTAGNGFRLRAAGSAPGAAGISGLNWQNLAQTSTTQPGEGDRNNIVRYVSPTIAGFNFSAAWGEDDMWDVALRYAGEFSGVRLAAGIGYRQINDFNTGDGMSGCANLGPAAAQGTTLLTGATGTAPTSSAVDCNSWGGSIAVMHVPTGLFASFAYGKEEDDNRKALFGANVKDDAEGYFVMAGIEKNWFGLGATSIYGEYSHGEYGASLNNGSIRTLAATDPLNSLGATARISSSETDVWGVGIQQAVDAAAMELYIGYKNYSGEARLSATGSSAGSIASRSIDDFQLVIAGARIRF